MLCRNRTPLHENPSLHILGATNPNFDINTSYLRPFSKARSTWDTYPASIITSWWKRTGNNVSTDS